MSTTRRLNDITARLWDTGFRYGGWFLTWAALWLVTITLLGLWLPGTAVASLAVVVPIGITVWFVARYIWWPTGPTAIATTKLVKKVSKIDLTMLVVAVLAITLGWGLFVAYWPIEDGPRLLPLFVGLVILAVLLWKLGLKKLSWVAAIIAVSVMLNIPAPGTFTKADTSSAAVTTGQLDESQLFYEFTLLGETEKSEPFEITRLVPPNWDYRWRGPEDARVHWSDGSSGKLTEMWGVKGGRVWFTGTAGDVVLVRIIPPGSD